MEREVSEAEPEIVISIDWAVKGGVVRYKEEGFQEEYSWQSIPLSESRHWEQRGSAQRRSLVIP